MQKVDALTDLQLSDARILRDARILSILRDRARNLMLRPALRLRGGKHPALYSYYRGTGFPLRTQNGQIPLAWRSLTPWMKVQLATLVLSQRGYVQFNLHIHDDLRGFWEAAGRDLKTELRNSMARHLKRRFGSAPPSFLFVIEDLTKDRQTTRPHVHGSIELRETNLPKGGEGSRSLPRLALTDPKQARLKAAKLKIREALWASSGGKEPRIALTTGLHQVRNVWLRKPYHSIFNSQWVDYAFKNTREFSSTLGEGRLAMDRPLLQEARRFWQLVREGEDAMEQWDSS